MTDSSSTHDKSSGRESGWLFYAQDGMVVISWNSDAQEEICRFAIADVEYCKGCSVSAMCVDVKLDPTTSPTSGPRLLFLGDSNGRLYTFDVGIALDPNSYNLMSRMESTTTNVARHPRSTHKQHEKSNHDKHSHNHSLGRHHHHSHHTHRHGRRGVKLFEEDTKTAAISSIVLVPHEPMRRDEGAADDESYALSAYLLAVGAVDSSITLFTSALVGVCTLKIAPIIREPRHRVMLEMLMHSGEQCRFRENEGRSIF